MNNLKTSFLKYFFFLKERKNKSIINPKYLNSLLRNLALICFLSCWVVSESLATHFRYSNITWKATGNPNEIEFTVELAYRTTIFSQYPNASDVAIGDMVTEGIELEYGDGTGDAIILEVTSFNVSEDWLFGVATLVHTYASPGDYTALIRSCCRISSLQNNASDSYRNETIVNVGANNNPPISSLPPIINLPVNEANASFFFTANDVDGDNVRYRLATVAEGGDLSFTHPTGLAIDMNTGEITWSTVGLTVGHLYNTAVIAEDLDGAGNVKSKTQTDFLLKVTIPNDPPVFVAPTPADGTTFSLAIGTPFSLPIQATDPDGLGNPGGNVSINAVGQPVGVTFTPSLPSVIGNPAMLTLNWTPTAADVGTSQVTFIAMDDLGGQVITRVNLTVVAVPTVTFEFAIDQDATSPLTTEICNCQEQCITATALDGASAPLVGQELELTIERNGILIKTMDFTTPTDANGQAKICFINDDQITGDVQVTVQCK